MYEGINKQHLPPLVEAQHRANILKAVLMHPCRKQKAVKIIVQKNCTIITKRYIMQEKEVAYVSSHQI